MKDDVKLVARFSASMNRELTQAAYLSESIPASSVSFSWNEASTELTITPNEPLEYASGADPASVEARRYGFFISASAEDVDGNQLRAARGFSFSVLRQINRTLSPRQQRAVTGNWRSNDTYGNASCGREQTTVCVGDSFVNGGEEQYKGFLTFDLSSLPSGLGPIARAELELEVTGVFDDPFAGLGALILEHVAFEDIGLEAFTNDPISELGPIANAGVLGGVIDAEVSSAVAADTAERSVTQFRFRFDGDTDEDATSDLIVMNWDAQRLVVSYLVP